jgi:hypothetical protein
MTEPRVSTFDLDLALLEACDTSGWSERDRRELERLRLADRAFLQQHPRAATIGGVRVPRRGRWKLVPFFAAAATIAAVAILLPRTDGIRAKGGSAMSMYVKRGAAIEPFEGKPLAPGDTLAFRYTTTRRRLILAGREDSGRTSVYANSAIEPGDEQTLPTGVELDEHVGTELVIAIFSDEPIDSAILERQLARIAMPASDRDVEDIEIRLPVATDQTVWRIIKQDRK